MISRPMLAEAVEDISQIKFPCLLTPKLDGIRCLKVNGKAISRKFKAIPNNYIRNHIESLYPDGVDGELMCQGYDFNSTQSLIMTESGRPNFTYFVFDFVVDLKMPYKDRISHLKSQNFKISSIALVLPELIQNSAEFIEFEEKCIELGHEGVIIRSPDGPYKCGRSTLREGYLLKFKRFNDSEAIILDFIEAEENRNEVQVNELGLSKRSHAKEGKVKKGTLGAFKVKDIYSKVEFEIGTGRGLTIELRQKIWNNKELYKDKIINYRYQPAGQKDKPRFPSFHGFRDVRDMS